MQTTSGSVCENDHRVQGCNPVSNSFQKFNTTVHVLAGEEGNILGKVVSL